MSMSHDISSEQSRLASLIAEAMDMEVGTRRARADEDEVAEATRQNLGGATLAVAALGIYITAGAHGAAPSRPSPSPQHGCYEYLRFIYHMQRRTGLSPRPQLPVPVPH